MGESQFLCRPQHAHEQLLDVLFLDDCRAARRWCEWRAQSDIDFLEAGIYELLPLLYRRLEAILPDEPWIGRLKGVYKRTWTHNILLFRNTHRAVGLLQSHGIDAMLMKGMGMLPYYGDPGLRTMADADVLVRPEQASLAADCLTDHGWRPNPACSQRYLETHIIPGEHGWNFVDGELQLDLHWSPVHRKFGEYGTDALWENAVERGVLGMLAPVPGAADVILLTLIHGVMPQHNRAVQWVTDVMHVLGSGLDTGQAELLARRVRERRFSVWSGDMLGYLRWRYGVGVLPLRRDKERLTPGDRLEFLEFQQMIEMRGQWPLYRRAACLMMSMRRNAVGRSVPGRVLVFSRPLVEAARRRCRHQWQVLKWRINRNRFASNWLRRAWPGALLPPKPDWNVPVFSVDDIVRTSRKGTGYRYAVSGWALQEADHLWSDGYQARIVFSIEKAVRGHIKLTLAFTPYVSGSDDIARIDLALNRRWCERLTCFRSAAVRHGLFIQTAVLGSDRVVDLVISPLDPGRPADEGEREHTDDRLLGVCLTSLDLTPLPPWDMAGEIVVASGQAGERYLGIGWWQPEPTGVWTSMPRSRLRVPLVAADGGEEASPISRLDFVITPLLREPDNKRLHITLSGRFTGSQDFDIQRAGEQTVGMPLGPPSPDPARDYLDIELQVDGLSSPEALFGTADRRHLGVMLCRIIPCDA